jgi:hypothetical protein
MIAAVFRNATLLRTDLQGVQVGQCVDFCSWLYEAAGCMRWWADAGLMQIEWSGGELLRCAGATSATVGLSMCTSRLPSGQSSRMAESHPS